MPPSPSIADDVGFKSKKTKGLSRAPRFDEILRRRAVLATAAEPAAMAGFLLE